MKCWPPLKPKTFYLLNSVSKCSPWCLMGPLCSTCVHSHIHLHYMCKMYSQSVQPFDQNFPGFWIVDPLKPPKMPTCGTVGRIVFSLCPFPDESTDMYEIWCQSVEQFDSFPSHLNLWPSKTPPKCPLGANRSNCWCQSVQPFDSFSRLLNVCVSKGNLFGVYPFPDESAHVCQIWCQSVQPFDSFNRLLNLWPLNPQKCHLGYWGANCI